MAKALPHSRNSSRPLAARCRPAKAYGQSASCCTPRVIAPCLFLKPTVTREAGRRYGIDLPYASRPSWRLYKGLLDFVAQVRADVSDLRPRDMIDMQSFIWVQGSDEYPD
jgi:hypothetical protein